MVIEWSIVKQPTQISLVLLFVLILMGCVNYEMANSDYDLRVGESFPDGRGNTYIFTKFTPSGRAEFSSQKANGFSLGMNNKVFLSRNQSLTVSRSKIADDVIKVDLSYPDRSPPPFRW
ncbi:MAG: hypothetical protein AAGH99_09055 [Planctomycetota bacterium]